MFAVEQMLSALPVQESPKELETADPRLEAAGAAAIRGDYQEAARLAAEVYDAGIFDVRLLGYLLYADLLTRGPGGLPLVLGIIAKVLSVHLAAFTPVARREALLDGALNWVLGKVVRELRRAEQLRDASWHALADALAAGEMKPALAAATELQTLLVVRMPQARALAPLLQLIDLLRQLQQHEDAACQRGGDDTRESSSAAITQANKDEDSDDVDDEGDGEEYQDGGEVDDGEVDDGADDDSSGHGKAYPRVREHAVSAGSTSQGQTPRIPDLGLAEPEQPVPPSLRPLLPGFVSPSAVSASAALKQLAQHIQLFVALVEADQYVHAAVLAAEVQRAIDGFDPRVYLPALLKPYFHALARCSDELNPILERRDHLAFRTLVQLFQVDPEGFAAQARQAAGESRFGAADHSEDDE